MSALAITGTKGFLGSNVLSAIGRYFPETNVSCVTYASSIIKLPETSFKLLLAGGYSPKSSQEFNVSEARGAREFVERLLASRAQLCSQVWLVSSTDASSLNDAGDANDLAPRGKERTQYQDHKKEMERFTQDICRKIGLGLVIIRLGPLYGPGEESYHRLIPATIKSAIAGDRFQFRGDSRFQRPFLFSRDAAGVLSQMVHSEIEPGTYDLVGKEQIDWNRIKTAVDTAVRGLRAGTPDRDIAIDYRAEFEVQGRTIRLLNSTAFESGIQEEVRRNFRK